METPKRPESEKNKVVVENSGEGKSCARGPPQLRKTYHKTPPQKWLWTPPPIIRFSPPFVHALSFSLAQTRPISLSEPSRTAFGGRTL